MLSYCLLFCSVKRGRKRNFVHLALAQMTGVLRLLSDGLNQQNNLTMSEQLQEVADLITANTIFTTKKVLTTEEAARYLGVSISYLYKLTMLKKIPHSKPLGKKCYFDREELEQWLLANRIATNEEIEQQAQAYCLKKGGQK